MSELSTRRRQAGPRPALALASFLPYRLNLLAAVVSEGLARRYGARFGIGIAEWRVLATVGEFRSATASAIGRHAHMGKVKVSRAAAALARRGLIARRANADDRREAFLVLTAKGRQMYRRIAPLAQDYARRLTAELAPAERVILDRLIDGLQCRAAALEENRGAPPPSVSPGCPARSSARDISPHKSKIRPRKSG